MADDKRIVYQAAPGERVVIKGSEIVKGWEKVAHDTWKITLPDEFFGDFNPFKDVIHGDWFNPRGRVHHTGAVYLDGHWLTEAASLEPVLEPAGENPLWFTPSPQGNADDYLLNVAYLSVGKEDEAARRVPAEDFTAQQGIQTAACSEGGRCVGWVNAGDWVRYDNVDFGDGTQQVAIRAASPREGGRIELRLDKPRGPLVGVCDVSGTGDWQKWKSFTATIKPTSGTRDLCLVFRSHEDKACHREAEPDTTTIWAQFPGVDPNEEGIEINVRQAVFYPEKPGMNYITVRGFILEHAATPWAPPTAEQIGLIGVHWSKGWIIENNTIRYSTCTGVTLGKHGDEFDNTSSNTAEGYVETIKRAHQHGWSKENIGHHIVRNNHISHCEQAGIVGSMGPIFSQITGNTIHDIHVRQLFGGAEMAGIKFHGAIDTVISRNHISRTTRGIWLDWMTQGTHVTRNLLYDNGAGHDLFVEVNHGPFLVDHNIMLSPDGILDVSQGGAYAHNLIAGRIRPRREPRRETPYHPAHSTEIAGLHGFIDGDDRYYNNLFVGGSGLAPYDAVSDPLFMGGNVFLAGAKPSKHEQQPLALPQVDPGGELSEKADEIYLDMNLDKSWATRRDRPLVTTELLGKAKIPDLPYEQPDGSAYRLDTDYFGRPRNEDNPLPGPFALPDGETWEWKIWPVNE
ncbi:MAG: carbohydrate-binding protein [Pirellulaceae bacterium]